MNFLGVLKELDYMASYCSGVRVNIHLKNRSGRYGSIRNRLIQNLILNSSKKF